MGCVSSTPKEPAASGEGNKSASGGTLSGQSSAEDPILDGYDLPKDGTKIDSRRVSTTDNLSKDNRGSGLVYKALDSKQTSVVPDNNTNDNDNNDNLNTEDLIEQQITKTDSVIYNASDNIPFGSIYGDSKITYFEEENHNENENNNDNNNNDNNNENTENNENNSENNNSNDTNNNNDNDNNNNNINSNSENDGYNIYYWRLKLVEINAAMKNSHTRDVFIGVIKESVFEKNSKQLLNRHFLFNDENISNGYGFSPKTGQLYIKYPDSNAEPIEDNDYYKWDEQDSLLEFVLDYSQQSIFYRVLNNENEKLIAYDPQQYRANLKAQAGATKDSTKSKSKKLKDKKWIKLFDNIELCDYRFAITLKGNDYIKLSLINPIEHQN